ncbi:hypothetical protein T10_11126 [Trichinella papuae]|uniref:Uncharacterized protein n=1 Tax=Trichinella papuae TaxID=268474 RepID=A0A0V1N589_9BILA|nr:hypothetical protein T10_11126 [Trichinella papuae]
MAPQTVLNSRISSCSLVTVVRKKSIYQWCQLQVFNKPRSACCNKELDLQEKVFSSQRKPFCLMRQLKITGSFGQLWHH